MTLVEQPIIVPGIDRHNKKKFDRLKRESSDLHMSPATFPVMMLDYIHLRPAKDMFSRVNQQLTTGSDTVPT